MPPRSLTLAIVVFWLAVAGLFLTREVWPRLAPSEPPMFPVDLVDEAGRQEDRVDWLVTKNDGGGYRASTTWTYAPEDDTFRSRCQITYSQGKLERPRALGLPGLPQFHRVNTDSYYYLTRAGRMTRLEIETKDVLALPGRPGEKVKVTAKVRGPLDAGRFTPHVAVSCGPASDDVKLPESVLLAAERDGAPVPVPGRGIVLDLLHPPRRFPELRPGQTWRVTVLDPFALLDVVGLLGPGAHDLLRGAGLEPGAVTAVLDARVLPVVEDVALKDRPEQHERVPCRVIRCTAGDDELPELTLWVSERDGPHYRQGTVFRQRARTLSGDLWEFTRRPPGYRMELIAPDPEDVANLLAQALAVPPAGVPLGWPVQLAAPNGVMGANLFAPAGKP